MVFTDCAKLRAELRLIWKDDIVPLLYPVLPFGVPELLSLSVALSTEAKVMVAKLTGHPDANVEALYDRKLACCKHAHFLTKDQGCGFTVLQGSPHMFVLLAVSHGKSFRSSISFNMTLNNPFIPYSRQWMDGYQPVKLAISWNNNPHSR